MFINPDYNHVYNDCDITHRTLQLKKRTHLAEWLEASPELINSAILMVAAASFYYGAGKTVGDLFDAYYLIKEYLGKGQSLPFYPPLLSY